MRKAMIALALVAGLASQAMAQNAQTKPFMFGPEASWMSQSVGIGVGARAVYTALGQQLNVPGLQAYGAFDYFFPGSSYGVSPKYWEINAGATYDLKLSGMKGFAPYVGAGLNYAHSSVEFLGVSASASKTGLNVLGGGRFTLGKMNAFAEARFELGGGEAFAATFGILF